MITTFEDQTDFERFVESHLAASKIAPEHWPVIVECLTAECAEFTSTEEGDEDDGARGLMIASGPLARWVVRDEDIKGLEALLDLVSYSVPLAFLLPTDPLTKAIASASVGTLKSIIPLMKRVWDRGTRPDQRAFAVLVTLKASPGQTAADLLTLLQTRDRSWTDEELQRGLSKLSAHPTRTGAVVSLVSRDGGGRWYCNGV